VKILWRPRSQ
jgi:hypothetical protein